MSNFGRLRAYKLSASNQVFDVTIKKRDYDIKNSIVMQEARGLSGYLN